MKDEEIKEGMSTIKKTLIGVVTTAVTAAGAYVTTHIDQIFGGGEKEEAKTEQVHETQSAPAQTAAPITINIENTNQQKQSSGSQPTRVIERVVEKPVEKKKTEEESDEDPW